jgi:rhodanese-related sulfurtransferase
MNLSGGYCSIDVDTARRMIEERGGSVVVLDVRNPEEWYGETGHIEGALLIPFDALPMNLDKLDPHKEKDVICVCYVGQRSAVAAQFLSQHGFRKTYNVEGGMMEWFDRDLPAVNKDTWPNEG